MYKVACLSLFQLKPRNNADNVQQAIDIDNNVCLVEWLTRCPAKAMLFERVGSNPAADDNFLLFFVILQRFPLFYVVVSMGDASRPLNQG